MKKNYFYIGILVLVALVSTAIFLKISRSKKDVTNAQLSCSLVEVGKCVLVEETSNSSEREIKPIGRVFHLVGTNIPMTFVEGNWSAELKNLVYEDMNLVFSHLTNYEIVNDPHPPKAYQLALEFKQNNNVMFDRLDEFIDTLNNPKEVDRISKKAIIRDLAEQLDTHRKRQQAQHPDLTMTGVYNVLEKLRSGAALTAREKTIHEQGLVSVRRQLHDELNTAVFDAYGWPATTDDAEILERLVALNAERAAEEALGKIRWLRPEYQCPAGAGLEQGELAVTGASSPVETEKRAQATERPWPKSLPDQVRILREALTALSGPTTAEAIARQFTRARTDRVEELLETLVVLGQARKVGDTQFVSG